MSASDTIDYRSRLIAAREQLDLTPREMAERLLTPRQTYEQWERGARRTPGLAVLAAEMIIERENPKDWPDILRRAKRDGYIATELADRLGITRQAVRDAEKRYGVRLPKDARGST